MRKEVDSSQVLRTMMLAVSLYLAACALFLAFLYDSPASMFQGFVRILTSPSKLTIDYFELGGLSATLWNIAIVGLVCWGFYRFSGATVTGASVMAFFLTIGFCSFGMNALNIWPFFLGTWLYSLYKKERFSSFVNTALFSTALSPFVSEALFADYGLSWPIRLLVAVGLGCMLGFIASLTIPHMVSLHKGFNQFNAGLSNGFTAFLIYSVIFGGLKIEKLNTGLLGDGENTLSICILFVLFIGLAIWGWSYGGKRLLDQYGTLLNSSSHKMDYSSTFGASAVLFNLGIYGAFVTLYYIFVGAAFTGPTFGCVLCMLALTATCANPKTVYPIMLGYVLFSLLPMSASINVQSILVGLCFATALAPISGVYGPVAGVLAGFLHCAMVTSVPAIHGGFNLYNGGFASGLLCLTLVPVLEGLFPTKEERKQRQKEKALTLR